MPDLPLLKNKILNKKKYVTTNKQKKKMYILVKNDIEKHLVHYIDSYSNKDDALSNLFYKVKQDENHTSRIVSDHMIHTYASKKGFIYNTKNLVFIYQVLKIDPPCNNKKKKDS